MVEPADAPDSDTHADSPSGAEPTSPRPSGMRWLVWALLGVLLAIVIVPVSLTATPKQCAMCHEMKPYYESWRTSSHQAAVPRCVTCHVKPGFVNLAVYELGFYRMIAGHFAGAEVKSTSANAPSVASCRLSGCHSLNRETSNSGDIKINHRLHVTVANIACPRCHPGAVHDGVDGRLKLPPMKLCKECHADKMSDCSYCHTQQHLQAQPGTH